jgi:glycosyltransferase involved in cell wall biosynthesis
VPGKIILYYNDLEFSPSDAFLTRDFGQVPFVLAERHGLDLEYWISAEHPNPAYDRFRGKPVRQYGKAMRGLPRRLDLLKNRRLYRDLAQTQGLTHLVLFPFTPVTDLHVARVAKRRHPAAKVIVKLDTNADFLRSVEADWQRHGRRWTRRLRQSHHYRELLALADAIICETSVCEAILRADFLGLKLGHKLAKTFSGVSETWLAALGVPDAPEAPRGNSIVVSGRLSIPVKYTSLIFEAGGPPPGWTIEFVGEIDEALQRTIDSYRAGDAGFDQRYRFHGVVTDKRAYYEILMRSRALLMNSRGPEGFPNVYADAHFSGLFIVTSDIASSIDATEDGRWGIIYKREDAAALRAALDAMPEQIAAFERDPAAAAHRRAFIWEHSLDQPAIRNAFGDAGQPGAAGR